MTKTLKHIANSNLFYISLIVTGICSYYWLQLNDLNIPNEFKNFYLTLSYPTDPLYWKLISSFLDIENYPLGHNSINFFIERIISLSIGNDLVWITAPIFKIISLLIIFLSCKYLFKLNNTQSIIFLFFIFLILLFNNSTFDDRFARPHITQLLIPISISIPKVL